jgi:putative ABC transport system ATP-binding protein
MNRNTASMSALIETRALTRMDERRQLPLLQPTNFTLNRADRVSITGSSGSGKSVFLRALALLDVPSSGQILWNNQPIANAQIPHYRSHISYLSQRPALLEGTVEDNLRFPFSLKTLRQRRFDLAAVTALLEHAGKAPDFLAKNAGDLSGGESQVVSLIRTLQLNPEVLLLDEPTAALDPSSSRDVEALIDAWFAADNSRAYIWVSHDLDQARRMSAIHLHMSAGVLSEASQP